MCDFVIDGVFSGLEYLETGLNFWDKVIIWSHFFFENFAVLPFTT